MSVNDYVKYSFLDVVGDYVKEMGIDDISKLDDPKYDESFERAVERIRNSVDNKVYIPKLEMPNTEIISFLISTILLRLSNNTRLIKRFALYESKGIESSLRNDILQNKDIAFKIISSFYSDTMKKEGKYYSISIPNYLKHSTELNADEWKLVNQRVDSISFFVGFTFICFILFTKYPLISVLSNLTKFDLSNKTYPESTL